MIPALVLLPALSAVLCFFIRAHAPRRALLSATALAHAALTLLCWFGRGSSPILSDWLYLDAPGLLILSVTSLLFLAASLYAVGFLGRQGAEVKADEEEGFLFDNIPEAVFTACLLGFLSAMSLTAVSRHFGLLWVAVEATTLSSAPLIHYHRHHRSLEAAWKYLLLCSVGIAVALLGTFFLAAAASNSGEELTFPALLSGASRLDPTWLKAAFLLLLVGYGTKMGLAPLHAWLPDAHSEAPSLVSALLSGALLNCAFLAVLRAFSVLAAAGLGQYGRDVLLVFGLLSMGAAAAFIVGQPDYKRMLAYSSVENVGILAVGLGIGGLGNWGSFYHAVNHSLVKAALFLAAGNILAVYGTKKSAEVRGLFKTLPLTAALWTAGFFAITGAPPFGSFLSELTILRAAVQKGLYGAAAVYSVALVAAFTGMVSAVAPMVQGPAAARLRGPGTPDADSLGPLREPLSSILPSVLLLGVSAALGLVVPRFLDAVLHEAAGLLGG
jgi:hydrogenase-4 component F